jgi:hypothetical protein
MLLRADKDIASLRATDLLVFYFIACKRVRGVLYSPGTPYKNGVPDARRMRVRQSILA